MAASRSHTSGVWSSLPPGATLRPGGVPRPAGPTDRVPDPAVTQDQTPPPPIHIVLAARNGAAFLPEQLSSLAAQSETGWRLVAGDDGSADATPGLLAGFAASRPAGQVALHPGPRKGSGAHFLSLLAHVPPGHPVAFCDQDDVWLPDRLARGLALLAGPEAGPAVAAGRLIRTDRSLRPRGLTPEAPRGPSFTNALVQNILPGCSILMNAAAADLVRATAPAAVAAGVPFHDWWVYLMLTGTGGRVALDPEPRVFYRQHGGNAQGSARLARLGQAMRRRYAGWVGANLAALSAVRDRLTPEARHTAEAFAAARRHGPAATLHALRALGIHRQTASGDRALRMMARMGFV